MSRTFDDPDYTITTIPFEARKVAAVLHRWAPYDENADAMEWLASEARDVWEAVQDGTDPADVLFDTGYWSEDDFPDALRSELISAAGGLRRKP